MQTERSPYPVQRQPDDASDSKESRARQYINFSYYKLDPAWRRLSKEQRDKGITEWLSVYHAFRDRLLIYPYTLFGIRADADFMLWRISYRLEDFVEMATAFHTFYERCRVVSSDPDELDLSKARLRLVEAARTVLARCLALMLMSAPEEM